MNRRTFIQLSAAVAALGPVAASCNPEKPIAGKIVGASAKTGHLMRDNRFTGPATPAVRKQVAIVGGGISGLTAARYLQQNGVTDYVVLDLEAKMGGNAAHGTNAVSAYPWGAHYVPVPNNNLTDYLDFLQECNVITGTDSQGLPVYNEYYLCFDPEERLYINGRWQEGLVPQYGVPEDDLAQIRHFLHLMDRFRAATGKDGKEAFTIPLDASSRDEVFTRLDGITMKQWLLGNGFTSAYLHWYLNYCTRDDFGTPYDQASAWAGIHYFACRKGKGANAERQDVITWPEGNGWLAAQLQKYSSSKLLNNCLVVSVNENDQGVNIRYYDTTDHTLKAIDAAQCIIAVPQFVAARMLDDKARLEKVHRHFHYAPWMVANIRVSALAERSGPPVSWDNVVYGSDSLGYVNATHQLLQQDLSRKNLTYYLPLTDLPPAEARRSAMLKTHEQWVAMILSDLQKVHPGIREATEEVNIMLWGHAMVQPLPGLIHGPVRGELASSLNNKVHFAHTDLAGISIFEEAFYQGLGAAKKVVRQVSGEG